MGKVTLEEFDQKIDTVEKLKIPYDIELEELKDMFLDYFEQELVMSLLGLIINKGHLSDRERAKLFKIGYENNNFTVSDIKWFKKAFIRYNDLLMSELNEEGENI